MEQEKNEIWEEKNEGEYSERGEMRSEMGLETKKHPLKQVLGRVHDGRPDRFGRSKVFDQPFLGKFEKSPKIKEKKNIRRNRKIPKISKKIW